MVQLKLISLLIVVIFCFSVGCLNGVNEYHYYGVKYNGILIGDNVSFANTNWENWTILFERLDMENLSIRYDIYEKYPDYQGISFRFTNTSEEIFIGGGIYFEEDEEIDIYMEKDEIALEMFYSYDGFGIDVEDVNKSEYMELYEEQKGILEEQVHIIITILEEVYDVRVVEEHYKRRLQGPIT